MYIYIIWTKIEKKKRRGVSDGIANTQTYGANLLLMMVLCGDEKIVAGRYFS